VPNISLSYIPRAVPSVTIRNLFIAVRGWRGGAMQARKQSFVRHTVREYHIHKALDHPNVVRLHDVFEIDANTFCTVLDYCTF
jgi:tousled-like kinase